MQSKAMVRIHFITTVPCVGTWLLLPLIMHSINVYHLDLILHLWGDVRVACPGCVTDA